MPDDFVAVSSAAAVRALQDGLGRTRSNLEEALDILDRALRVSDPVDDQDDDDTDSREIDPRSALASAARLLSRVRADLEGARVAASLLVPATEPTPRIVGQEGQQVSRRTSETTGGATFKAIPEGMSPTTDRRMAEIADTLRLSDAQAVERCVATQHYVDARLHEGWHFFIKRGRDRRAVTFPGQAAA